MMLSARRMRTFSSLGALWTFVALVGCAPTQLFMHAAKNVPGTGGQSTAERGIYKVGEPYQINGIWYYPKVDYDYDESGIASWYGQEFHGKPTANGETFDMNQVTAAHRTLPMPSLVQVTNLENGRSLVVRVNDRGPFVAGRIIDLSRRSAQLLGAERQGTARVRVQVLADESRTIAEAMQKGRLEPKLVAATTQTLTDAVQLSPDRPNAAPRGSVTVQALPPPGAPASGSPAAAASPTTGALAALPPRPAVQVATLPPSTEAAVKTVPVVPTQIYIQVGAFQNVNNAVRVGAQLSQVGRAVVVPKSVGGRELFRVRFGPFDRVEDADAYLGRIHAAGFPDARVIVE
jgi:rare lipoprotein A